jgi:hypothetical protein
VKLHGFPSLSGGSQSRELFGGHEE